MSLATTNYAIVSPCVTHRRDAFYKIKNSKSHLLVLGRIDLQPLSIEQVTLIFKTSIPNIELLRASDSLILVAYITDDKGTLQRRKKEFSVIDVTDCPHHSPIFLDPYLLDNVYTLASDIINSVTYLSEQTKRSLLEGPLGFAKNVTSPRKSALNHMQPVVPPVRQCQKCNASFQGFSDAQCSKHYNAEHPEWLKASQLSLSADIAIKQCEICKNVFTSKGLSKHKSQCPCSPVTCPFTGCNATLPDRGSGGTDHLVYHLKTMHTDPENKDIFSDKSAEVCLKVKDLQFCTCSKHVSGNFLHASRLFTKNSIKVHERPDPPRDIRRIGEGEKWSTAFDYILKILNSLDPSHVTFKPVWGHLRTRYFDYYRYKNISMTAFAAYESLMDQLVSLSPDDNSPLAISLWFLTIYFDPIIFRGDKKSFSRNQKDVKDCIDHRVKLLLSGDIETLWISLTGNASTLLSSSAETPKEQRVADLMEKGRFSDAANEATSELKRPPMNDAAIAAFENAVVPPSLQHQTPPGIEKRCQRGDPLIDDTLFAFTPDPDDPSKVADPDLKTLLEVISKTKKGKGAGILGDTLDFYKVMSRSSVEKRNRLPNLLEIIRRVLRGQLPSPLRPIFNLLAGSLFIKPETNPVAYRPIGCPSSFNRLVGKFFCAIIKESISSKMLKANQFAVGVKGGMSLLLASLQLLVQKHMQLDDTSELDRDPSKRALISTDLTSMFNVCNLDVFFDWCSSDPILSKFIPYLECRYKFASTYILKKEDGTFVHVTQPDGCAQGCPLAPLIASSCLIILIDKFIDGNLDSYVSPPSTSSVDAIYQFTEGLNSHPEPIPPSTTSISPASLALKSIMSQQECFVESKGAPILSFMDDMSTVASYSYIIAFARFLVRYGPLAGVYVNWRKTQVLLGSNWDSSWRDVSEDGKTILLDTDFISALTNLGIPRVNIITSPTNGPTALAKIKGGLKILGAPFGFRDFNKQFRAKTLVKQLSAFDAVSAATPDKEHLYKLIRHCIIPKVYHMFSAASALDDIAEFAKTCHDQHIRFFERYLNDGRELDPETKHSFDLATLLTRQGGIHFTSPLLFYKAGFLATWSKLFFVGSHPPLLDSEDAESRQSPLHTSIQSIIDNELPSPTLRCCVDYHRCFNDLLTSHPEEFGKDIAGGIGLTGLIRAAASDRLQHAIVEATSRTCFVDIYSTLRNVEVTSGRTSHLRKIMPSSAQMLGSAFLDNLDMGPDKMSSDSFFLFTKIKLGLPILDLKMHEVKRCPFCSKAKALDRFGEHIFSCSHFMSLRTERMHNSMRDSFAHVLGKLAKLNTQTSSFISSVTIEKAGLVENTALRPADIYATFTSEKQMLNQQGKSLYATSVAFDVTYAAFSDVDGYDGHNISSSFGPSAFPHLLKAELTKRHATHGGLTPGGTAQYLATRSTSFVPLAFDYAGGMGPQCSLVIHDTLTGRRIESGRCNTQCESLPAVLAGAHWVTPNMAYSDDVKLYQPPYHPSCINGQLKSAIQQIKKDVNRDGESETWQAHAAVHRISLSLSTRHADGVSTIARVFQSSISAAKGKVANLPSLTNSDAIVIKEVLKAVEFIKSNPLDDECAYSTQSSHQPDDSEGGDENGADLGDTLQHDTSPIYKALRDNISKITTPALAIKAAVDLRLLLKTHDPVSDTAIHNIFVRHNIRSPLSSAINTRPFPDDCIDVNRFMARRTLQVLEQSFRYLACLPRNLDDLIDNSDSSPTFTPSDI